MQFETGINPIGSVSGGAHFCHFYRTADDLSETLVPYFKAGLESNEAGIWVTAPPFEKERALSALNMAVDGLDRRIARGEMEIYDHVEWYERHKGASRKEVAKAWINAKDRMLAKGFRGLRLTGNTAFLEVNDWEDFLEYETLLRDVFFQQQLVALCSYNSASCDADAVLDVVQAHDFALARRKGVWEIIESASVQQSKAALVALNANLERLVEARTSDLSEALSRQRLLTAELSHRVKNTIASVQGLAEQTLRRYDAPAEARAALRGRLLALGRAHDQLAARDWAGVSLKNVLEAIVAPFGEKVALEISGEVLTPRATLNLCLIFHELTVNAVKYGALSTETGSVRISAPPRRHPVDLFEARWVERGGPSATRPAQEGFGLKLVRELITHDLKGECDIRFEPQGLSCIFRAPVAEILTPQHKCRH